MNLENCKEYTYSDDLFVFQTKADHVSQFDTELKSSWQEKMRKGYFRYSLEGVKSKHLEGKYNFLAQLNIKRAQERRKPQFISDVVMPFDEKKFHFGKVSNNEVLFKLNPLHWEKETSVKNLQASNTNVLIINVSPLEYCNSLLVPSIEMHYPQVVTFDGLRLAIEAVLISSNPALRLGFNSLGGYASVNHFHFHLYYLQHRLFLEHAKVEQLMGECYELKEFPAKGFVFQLLKKEDLPLVPRSIMKLLELLLEKKIAHNIFITRGCSFTEASLKANNIFNAVRIYIWARKSVFGSKNDTGFNPALCELGGHLPIKETFYFETVTEQDVSAILQDTCQETFFKIKDDVKLLYE